MLPCCAPNPDKADRGSTRRRTAYPQLPCSGLCHWPCFAQRPLDNRMVNPITFPPDFLKLGAVWQNSWARMVHSRRRTPMSKV